MIGLRGIVLGAALALGLCHPACHPAFAQASAAPLITQDELAELAALMLGDFATNPHNYEETIIDRRIAIIVEDQPGIWFYSQMNTGDDQSLYRQRFHQLALAEDGQSVIQRSYVAKEAARFADGWTQPETFAGLSMADMEPVLSDGCEQDWRRDDLGIWRGTVDPERCTVFSERRQVAIRIGSDSYYLGELYGTSERGFDEAMNPIWGSAPSEYIDLLRCRSHLCTAEARKLSERTE